MNSLLVIDLFADCLQHLSARRVDALIANTNALVAQCREADVPVIWVRQEFAADLSDAFLEMRRNSIRASIAGTPGVLLDPRLDVAEDERVIVKKRYSAFFGTNLDDVLAQNGTTGFIVSGVNTHACIRTTVIDACQRDLDVIIATDCIDSYDEEHAAVSLRYMLGKIAQGLSNTEIFEQLRV